MGKQEEQKPQLFDGLTFFLSNEIFREPFEFMLMAMGAKVIYHEDNFESEAFKDASITHVVTERDIKHSESR